MNRHTTLASAGAALLLALTACSSDGDKSQPSSSGGAGATLPAEATVPGESTAPAITIPPGLTEMGSCHVKVEGDVTAEWTSPGGMSAVGYGPWTPPSAGTIAGLPMDETFFILNCVGEGTNSLNFMPNTGIGIPMQPATYVIQPASNAFGTSEDGQITVIVGFDGPAGTTNWGPSEPGELVITAFDADHIAGTFRIPITDVLATLTGASMGNAVITGEFDYQNPN